MRSHLKTTVFVLILTICLLLPGCRANKTANSDVATTLNAKPEGVSSAEETTNNTVYDVHFFNDGGTQISQDTGRISEIEFPSLEEVTKPGFVFTGWDTDIKTMEKKEQPQDAANSTTTSTKAVEESQRSGTDVNDVQTVNEDPQTIDIKPVYIDVRNKDNVVAMPAVYGNAGSQFTVPLTLCGKVNLCGIDICVHYNRNKLKLVKYENVNKDVICNANEEKGDFRLNLISTANITEEIHFCDLVFEVIREAGGEEDLNIEIIEIVAFDKNNDLITPETNVIDTKIYAY